MIGLGIDPGFAAVGLGVLSFSATATRVLHHETFRTESRRKGDDAERLSLIADHLLDVIEEYSPAFVAYEDQALVAVGKARQGLPVTMSSQRVHEVSGIIRCAARCYDLPVYCYQPSSVKVGVLGKGGGRAKKARMIEAVRAIFHVQGCSEHVADAIAATVCGAREHRHLAALTQQHSALMH